LICVLGAAGGGRDKWKRTRFGELAGTYCDEIVLTNEDPYDEDPDRILSEIKSGISRTAFRMSGVHEIPDRREAIREALSLAKKGDVVVCTGKGSESFIHVAHGERIPWSEREVIEGLLK
jgi:UDP-N-acetylmuramoyl-L-alanyl-D-glutamate--2,6-diaminopimelate ligase